MCEGTDGAGAGARAAADRGHELRRCLPGHVFLNSVLLLFLTSLAMGRVEIILCLSLPALAAALFQVPLAHGAGRWCRSWVEGRMNIVFRGGCRTHW